jgi:hypothetical protein
MEAKRAMTRICRFAMMKGWAACVGVQEELSQKSGTVPTNETN